MSNKKCKCGHSGDNHSDTHQHDKGECYVGTYGWIGCECGEFEEDK